METVLGLLGIVVWISVVVSLAAAVTYVVVKVSPGEKASDPPAAPRSNG
ncbi:MAG: hypothetical protein ICV71_07185 [Thermoleophilia bacterium]|nr:hypothetical protein [Thermoleophilia bacterium]